MTVHIHPHALARMAERGATADEVHATVEAGEQFPAKLNRVGFRRNLPYGGMWRQKTYANKQLEGNRLAPLLGTCGIRPFWQRAWWDRMALAPFGEHLR